MRASSPFSVPPSTTTAPRRRDRLGLRGPGTDDDLALADDATLLVRATNGSVDVGDNAWGIVAALSRLESVLAHRDLDAPVTVWCAGAGGLAEPLTVAMLVSALGLQAEVLATDLCPLAAADGGPLPAWRLGRVPRDLRALLEPGPAGFVVGPLLRGQIRGVVGDLRDGAPAGAFDLVVCRDVLHHYRPAVARSMLAHLRQALAPHGVLLLSAVDALAAGLPLGSDNVVLIDGGGQLREPVAASTSPLLLLTALLHPEPDDGHKADRFAAIADAFPSLGEARLAAAIAASLAGDGRAARAHLAAGSADVDAAVVTAVIELRDERFVEARQALEPSSSSWLAPWLQAELLVRQHRANDARPFLRRALERLENCGDTTTPVVALMPEYDPARVRAACLDALQGRHSGWHGP